MQNCIKDCLVHDKEMYTPAKLLRLLSEADYFKENNQFKWPESFKCVLSEFDTLGLTSKSEYELALNAMGGVVWCLQKCLIDQELLTMKTFEIYNPIDNLITAAICKNEVKKEFLKQKYMVVVLLLMTNSKEQK